MQPVRHLWRTSSRAKTAADAIPQRPLADVETQVQGSSRWWINPRRSETVAWSTNGAPEGQAEIVPCTPMWTLPYHFDSGDHNNWMQEHNGDLQDTMNVGNNGRSLSWYQCCPMLQRRWQTGRVTMTPWLRKGFVATRYGLRGVRFGEASNPRPRLLRRYPGGTHRLYDISSDKSQWSLPAGMCQVDSTIPTTPRAVVQAGIVMSPTVTETELRGNRFPTLNNPVMTDSILSTEVSQRAIGLGLTTRDSRLNQPRMGSRHGEHPGNVRCGISQCCGTHNCPLNPLTSIECEHQKEPSRVQTQWNWSQSSNVGPMWCVLMRRTMRSAIRVALQESVIGAESQRCCCSAHLELAWFQETLGNTRRSDDVMMNDGAVRALSLVVRVRELSAAKETLEGAALAQKLSQILRRDHQSPNKTWVKKLSVQYESRTSNWMNWSSWRVCARPDEVLHPGPGRVLFSFGERPWWNHRRHQIGTHHNTQQTGWVCVGYLGRRHWEDGSTNNDQTNREENWVQHHLSNTLCQQKKTRVCCTHITIRHRPWPKGQYHLHWWNGRVCPLLQERSWGLVMHGRRRPTCPFHPLLQWKFVNLFVGRRDGSAHEIRALSPSLDVCFHKNEFLV